MKKEFRYISDFSHLLFVLLIILLPFALIAFACIAISGEKSAVVAGILCLLWLAMLILYYLCRYLKAAFQGDDTECEFQFRRKKLHFRYDEIKECELMYYPEHSRFGSVVGYKIHLHIIDKENTEHVIRQYVEMDYSFLEYPQGLPEEARKAELTEIGNFIKSRLVPVQPEKKTAASGINSNIADMPEILEALQKKNYIKNIEIQQTYDFIDEYYKKNLILTLTGDKTFSENDEIKIRFENISCPEININSMMPANFTILDHMSESYEPQNRYELTEEENNILSFYFEKAEITS